MSEPRLTLDARGKMCPTPLVMLTRSMREIEVGDVVAIQVDDRAFGEDVRAWCSHAGHQLLELEREGNVWLASVRKVKP